MLLLRKLLNLIYPIIEYVSTLHLPYTVKKITGEHYYYLRDQIEPGDLILSTTYGELSNLINPSELKHGSIYLGKNVDGICNVAQVTKEGVHLEDLVSHLTSKDEIKIIRYKSKFTSFQKQLYVEHFIEPRIDMPYDGEFKDDNKAFYCFELLSECLESYETNYVACKEQVFGAYAFTSGSFNNEQFKTIARF